MAKVLIVGQTVENQYGDIWDAAIMVVNFMNLDFLNQTFKFRVDVYKNATERTEGSKAISNWFVIDRDTFLANFVMTNAINTLKSQTENYALTLTDADDNLLYGDTFE